MSIRIEVSFGKTESISCFFRNGEIFAISPFENSNFFFVFLCDSIIFFRSYLFKNSLFFSEFSHFEAYLTLNFVIFEIFENGEIFRKWRNFRHLAKFFFWLFWGLTILFRCCVFENSLFLRNLAISKLKLP